ncbi:MAG: thermonuclease family protein [Planctomycetes bacterium]|nr:thermonuclease family protein [Planctomycetota bacterium]
MINASLANILNDRKAVRRLGIGALLVIALVVLFFSMFGDEEQERAARRTPFVEVKRILSGHTVKLESDQRLTYAGIRTPHQGEPLFEEARRRNADLVEGKEVRLRFDESDRDGKNRIQAYVYTDAGFVNEALVREGLAYVRLTPETRRFADLLLA